MYCELNNGTPLGQPYCANHMIHAKHDLRHEAQCGHHTYTLATRTGSANSTPACIAGGV